MTPFHPVFSRRLTLAVALIGLILTGGAIAAPQQVGHVQVELISETESFQAGRPFTVGLHLIMDEHWHVYWQNAGDAGLPPTLKWELPEGFAAGEIQWPVPQLIELGTLVNYGYEGDILLPVTITPPENLQAGAIVPLKVRADWLVCKEQCIPGRADLELSLPVVNQSPNMNPTTAALFVTAQNRQPLMTSEWLVTAELVNRSIIFSIAPPDWYADSLTSVTFFPYSGSLIEHAAPQQFENVDGGYRLTVTRSALSTTDPATVGGLLVSADGWRGPGSETAIAVDAPVGAQSATTASSGNAVLGTIWKAILFAFVGGLILNLMPCVLPVLSLKILGFVNQANESRKSAVTHGLVFTLGVLISFWVLAGVLSILRASGNELGWGFQLQSPIFLMVLSAFMFLFGLNLLGVFEIGTSLTAIGGGGVRRSGWMGSFLNGVTATVVATPCTAPFMGSALGFSLSQPDWVSWVVFTFLGLGMASPYVVLSASPGLLRFVPKPGRWMESLKQLMGFILMATVVWLSWVLSVQAGSTAIVFLLGTLLLLGMGAWVLGRWGTFAAGARTKAIAYTVTLLLTIGGLGAGMFGIDSFAAVPSGTAGVAEGELRWEPFDPQRVEELRAGNIPVFIDFTAAWCLSCQVNERVAFSSQEVRDRFEALGVVTMKADWTSRNETITRALAALGRNSVPLYVLYDGSGSSRPMILPEIITPGIVLDALDNLSK
jgi:thiol:disulfide interchange protein DsbD